MRESTVRFSSGGLSLVGTLCLPFGDPAPVVLLLSGFTGDRHEKAIAGTQDHIFSRTARSLAARGMASLRFDFRGKGDSEGDFADMTYERQIEDCFAAIRFVQSLSLVKADLLSLIGWSQGGLVAAAVAGRSNLPRSVALWAAVADPLESMTATLGAKTMQQGLRTGDQPLEVTLPWCAIALKQPFFEGVNRMDPLVEIAAYHGALLVTHGRRDTAVLPHAADKFLRAHRGMQRLWLADMDHSFNVETGPGVLDDMIGLTIDFLQHS